MGRCSTSTIWPVLLSTRALRTLVGKYPVRAATRARVRGTIEAEEMSMIDTEGAVTIWMEDDALTPDRETLRGAYERLLGEPMDLEDAVAEDDLGDLTIYETRNGALVYASYPGNSEIRLREGHPLLEKIRQDKFNEVAGRSRLKLLTMTFTSTSPVNFGQSFSRSFVISGDCRNKFLVYDDTGHGSETTLGDLRNGHDLRLWETTAIDIETARTYLEGAIKTHNELLGWMNTVVSLRLELERLLEKTRP